MHGTTRGARWVRAVAPSGWSLRTRLVAGVVALLAMALAVTGTLGVALLRSYLVGQVDQQLAVLAARPLTNFDPPAGGSAVSPPAPTAGDLPTPFVFTALSSTGQVLWQVGGSVSDGGPRPDLSGLDAGQVRDQAGRAFTVAAVGGGSGFRVRAVANADGSSTAMALSLHSSDAAVRRLETVTVVVALMVLALLVVSAGLVVRIGLRPLRLVEHTAENITSGDLSRRVPAGRANTEIGRLSQTLNSMLAQIEVAFAARARSEATLRQFIADASHELRTPLTTVKGYAELVNRGAVQDEAEQRHALARIDAEATRMGGLVEDLLLLAYLDQQRPLEVRGADLSVLVRDAVTDARARDQQRVIDYFGPDEAVPVAVDVDRMRQVLGNLLTNALVHTPPGTPVRVTVSADDEWVRVSVADHGPGIEPDQVSHLFERFYRADPSRSRARGGTGLGLAIVAAVVAASGGTVSCQSVPGQGATFTIALPISREIASLHSGPVF